MAATRAARPMKWGPVDKTVDAANVPANDVLDVSVTVAEAAVEDHIVVHMPALEDNLALSHAWCAVAGTVKVRLSNPTSGGVNPASQTWTLMAF